MRGLLRAIDHFSNFLGLAAGQLYLLCAVVTTYEVVMRYVFNAPTQWAFEVVMVLCASAWLFSSGYITLHRRHIGITVLYAMAPPAVRWWLDLLAMGAGLAATLILAYAALDPALLALGIIERTGSAFNSPGPTILKTLLVFGAALYAVQMISNLCKHFGIGDEEERPLMPGEEG
jgi:TRAP-type mannitol/chloroaromatic compound transport system permease small subunit